MAFVINIENNPNTRSLAIHIIIIIIIIIMIIYTIYIYIYIYIYNGTVACGLICWGKKQSQQLCFVQEEYMYTEKIGECK